MIIWKNSKNRKIILICLPAIILAVFILPGLVLADEPGAKKALDGLKEAAGHAFLGQGSVSDNDKTIIQDLPSTIGKIVGTGLALIGVIFLILMIYGGFTWMLARGNDQQVAKAKDLILAAIVGLVIVLASYAITAYIGDSFLK